MPMILGRQACQICGDCIEKLEEEKEPFVACHECAFPVCRTCYEYERREGSQACPSARPGSARVAGDEEEDGNDDLEDEFYFHISNGRYTPSVSQAAHSAMVAATPSASSRGFGPNVPLLTYGEGVDGIFTDSYALIIPSFVEILRSIQPRPINPDKDMSLYGYGTVAWKDRMEEWKRKQLDKLQHYQPEAGHDGIIDTNELGSPYLPRMDESRQPLSRKLPISSNKINPYRIIIILRLVVLGFFFHYRILHPVHDAYWLWLTSVICEIWFAVSWILDQFPKWYPIERETYLDRLSLRSFGNTLSFIRGKGEYIWTPQTLLRRKNWVVVVVVVECEGKLSELANIDIFVSSVDPLKEPPIITANTVLSILAVDYPVDKVSCYVLDDGASRLTFEALSEASIFAKKWVPFCKKFNIEPRAPEWYFAHKIDYLKDKVHPTFVRERRVIKREYEEFKVRINGLVAMEQRVPEEGWTMQDGTPWPGNRVRDHRGMIQVFLGHNGMLGDDEDQLPHLVYVSREKRPGFNHHKKAGTMNALVRVSAIFSNAPYILNVDCDHYINNSKALREAMCFMMDPISGERVGFVQFPQRFDGIDRHDRYSNRNVVFFDINMKCLDGIQGPIYVGTGFVFRRKAFYGFDAPVKKKPPACCLCCSSRKKKKKGILKKDRKNVKHSKASSQIHALRCIEGKVQEIANGNSSLAPRQKLQMKYGQSPIFVASTLQGFGGIAEGFCISPDLGEAMQVISCGYEDKTDWGKEIDIYASILFLFLFTSIAATGVLEMLWGGVGIDDWWRNEQFWVIGGTSSHLFALFQGLLKVLAGVDTNFTVTAKGADDGEFSELYSFKWTSLLIPQTTLLILNAIGVVAGISNAINNGYESWGLLLGKLFFAFWVIFHLYPFLEGLMGKQDRAPTIIVVWSLLLASVLSLMWVCIHPFVANYDGPKLEVCGLDCD